MSVLGVIGSRSFVGSDQFYLAINRGLRELRGWSYLRDPRVPRSKRTLRVLIRKFFCSPGQPRKGR